MTSHNPRLKTLAEFDLSALRDINSGMGMFVTARHAFFLITEGLASRGLDGRMVLTSEGLRLIQEAAKGAKGAKGSTMAQPSPS